MSNTSIDFIDLKSQYRELKTSIDHRIQAVLDHGQYIMGPEVGELEDKLAAFVGDGECITVASGTEALLIALMALGIKNGDEVITSPFTFAATAEVVALVGATPVFVDVEPDTCNINARLIEAAITKRTRAIMPVSLYGQAPDMDDINTIAGKYNLAVIDDAAQSFGGTYKDRRSCSLSTIGCTSFFPSKPLGCYGDGGAIFTKDAALAKAMREIRVHGQERRYHHTRVGVGGRMDSIQCAIVLAKLERFDWELTRREKIAQRYIRSLSGSNVVTPPEVRSDRTSAWAQFTVQVERRNQVIKSLNDSGVPTAIHYPIPLHLQPAYRDVCRVSGSLANAEHVADRVLSLPMHPYLSETTQDTIVSRLLTSAASA